MQGGKKLKEIRTYIKRIPDGKNNCSRRCCSVPFKISCSCRIRVKFGSNRLHLSSRPVAAAEWRKLNLASNEIRGYLKPACIITLNWRGCVPV